MLHAATSILFAASLLAGATPHDPEGHLAQVTARIAANPFAAELYLQRAAIRAQMSQPTLALLDYERAAELSPALGAAALGRAEELFELGRDAEALWCIERAIGLGEGGARVAWLRGRMLAALGHNSAAAEAFTGAMAQLPAVRPEHYLELAEVAGAAGTDAAALAVLQRGLDALGPVPALIAAAIELDLHCGAVDTALQRVDAVMARADRKAPWLLVRADVLQRAGRAAEAAGRRATSDARPPAAAMRPASPAVSFGAPPPAIEVPRLLIPRGSVWRYRDDDGVRGSSWRTAGFDDAVWRTGPAPLGYGEGDEATAVGFGSAPARRHVTTWFRRQFTIGASERFSHALLRLLRDDGAVVYLDGVELVRSNMPNGSIDPTTFAAAPVDAAEENSFADYDIDPSALAPGTHTLAVEVHQSTSQSSDLSFDLELVASQALVTLSRQPYLQDGTADGAVVRWRTSTPTATALWIGATPTSLQQVVFQAAAVTDHAATVRGLPAETRFYYGVGDAAGVLAGADATHFFTTLPPAGAVRPLRCWVLGDPGTGSAQARAVRDQYLAATATHPADILLLLGDNAYASGTDAQYQTGLFDVYGATLQNTFTWSTLGNHDALSASSAAQSGVYYDSFDLPRQGEAGGVPSGTEAYYSFDRGHVHFVCLDSQDTSRLATGAMMQWLQADLASTAAPWLVAFFHHPPYTKGTHDSDNAGDSGARMIDMRQIALPILEAHGVDLVLTGHSHTYERSYLLDGHYGLSSTFQQAMILDRGDGRVDGDGSYAKAAAGRGVHDGAVYVVAGSSGQSGSGPLNHPAMFLSMTNAGSLVVDVDGNRLDATFVTDTGTLADHFTLEKNVSRTLVRDVPALSIAAGGVQSFDLRAGPTFAGMNYLLAGALGTSPGLSFGGLHVPLNDDAFLQISLGLTNSSAYPGAAGVLDGNGHATAAVVLPPGLLLGAAGLSLYHAFVAYDGSGPQLVSNAVRVRLVP